MRSSSLETMMTDLPPFGRTGSPRRLRRGPRSGRSRLAGACIAAAVAVASVSLPAAAQQGDGGEVVVRIVARRLDGGRVEFGLQQRRADAAWADRQLPERRFFPATATVGRWLASSPVAVTLGASVTGSDVGAVPVSEDVFDFETVDVHTGETVNIRSVVTGETPLLFWLWSPY